jgi:predicted nucleic acid-binding Zn ribbon protein
MNKAEREIRKKKIFELYFKDHFSVMKIGEILNMSYGHVSKIIRSFTKSKKKERLYCKGMPVGYETKKKCPVCRVLFNSYRTKYCSKKCGGIGRSLSPEEKRTRNNIKCNLYYHKHKNDEHFKEQIRKHNRTQYPKLVASGSVKRYAENRRLKLIDLKLNNPAEYERCVRKWREAFKRYYYSHKQQILQRQKEREAEKKLLTV